eukprot:SAG31_NODE_6512_length_1991_cov_1.468816_1_plen_73_part_10
MAGHASAADLLDEAGAGDSLYIYFICISAADLLDEAGARFAEVGLEEVDGVHEDPGGPESAHLQVAQISFVIA